MGGGHLVQPSLNSVVLAVPSTPGKYSVSAMLDQPSGHGGGRPSGEAEQHMQPMS
jgi:hypothetical protein